MRFLIYIPGEVKGTAQAALSAVGLEHIAQGAECLHTAEGPKGPGKIFGWLDSQNADARYLPDEQTWLISTDALGGKLGAYWVGLWNDSPPTEAELRRPDHRRGAQMLLGNGESWSIPTEGTVDYFLDFGPTTGKQSLVIDEEFNWLKTDLEKMRATRITTIPGNDTSFFVNFDLEQDFDFLCRLMQRNYRITPEVVAHLRLWSVDAVKHTIAELMGYPLKG